MKSYKKVPSIKTQVDKSDKIISNKKFKDTINWNFSHIGPKAWKEIDKALLAEAKAKGVQFTNTKKI